MDGLGGTVGQILLGIGSWETIQFFLNKFYFEKKKNKNEDRGGEIDNNRKELDIMRDLNETLNTTVDRLQKRLEESEDRQDQLTNLIHNGRTG